MHHGVSKRPGGLAGHRREWFGGALALASPGNLWVTPDGYFAVIAPESAAAILKQDTSQVEAIPEDTRLMPQDLVRLGIVRGIIDPSKT